jgi:hypothetical protein
MVLSRFGIAADAPDSTRAVPVILLPSLPSSLAVQTDGLAAAAINRASVTEDETPDIQPPATSGSGHHVRDWTGYPREITAKDEWYEAGTLTYCD